jgi:hypothetical protein
VRAVVRYPARRALPMIAAMGMLIPAVAVTATHFVALGEGPTASATPCGVHCAYDYLAPIGKTPMEAMSTFRNTLVVNRTDGLADAERWDALRAAAAEAQLVASDQAHARFEARSTGGVTGVFRSAPLGDGYVIDYTWVPVPEKFCDEAEDPT